MLAAKSQRNESVENVPSVSGAVFEGQGRQFVQPSQIPRLIFLVNGGLLVGATAGPFEFVLVGFDFGSSYVKGSQLSSQHGTS